MPATGFRLTDLISHFCKPFQISQAWCCIIKMFNFVVSLLGCNKVAGDLNENRTYLSGQ